MEYSKEFISKLKARDQDAFALLYQETGRMIYNYILYRLGGDVSVAEDIQSEVYCDAMNHITSLTLTHNVKSWLYRITRSKIANYIREVQKERKWQTALPPEDLNLKATMGSPEFDLLLKEHKLLIQTAFLGLKDTPRELLKMKYLENLSLKEIAQKIDKTDRAVESLLFRARKQFAKELKSLAKELVYQKEGESDHAL